MEVFLRADGRNTADALRELYLTLRVDFRGDVRIVESDPKPGALGPVIDGLHMTLGAGGGAATLAGVIIAWLRTRRGEVTISVTRSDAETRIEMSAKGVRDLDPAALRELTARVAATIERGEPDATNAIPESAAPAIERGETAGGA